MPDWAIVLIAAFGGGLAGAVLQPVTSHLLEMIRRGEEIRRRRERSLRRMLQARMEHARTDLIVVELMCVYWRAGQPIPSASDLKNRVGKPAPVPFWAPSRISDPQLRQSATEHDQLFWELSQLLWKRPVGDATSGMVDALVDRFESVEADITRRMDELNWPEADD